MAASSPLPRPSYFSISRFHTMITCYKIFFGQCCQIWQFCAILAILRALWHPEIPFGALANSREKFWLFFTIFFQFLVIFWRNYHSWQNFYGLFFVGTLWRFFISNLAHQVPNNLATLVLVLNIPRVTVNSLGRYTILQLRIPFLRLPRIFLEYTFRVN